MTDDEVARAFSSHRFAEVRDRIAPDAVWTLVGQGRIEGRDAILDACENGPAADPDLRTTWLRFVCAGTTGVVAVDAIARYTGGDGVSTVSSCDVYEFTDGLATTITSYAVELPDDGGA